MADVKIDPKNGTKNEKLQESRDAFFDTLATTLHTSRDTLMTAYVDGRMENKMALRRGSRCLPPEIRLVMTLQYLRHYGDDRGSV